MYCLKLSFASLLLSFLILSNIAAQVNPVYNVMIKRGWVPLSNNDTIKLSPDQMRKNSLIAMGYNDSIISNFKVIGVDLLNPMIVYDYKNIKTIAAGSDCIIIGTVVRKEYPLSEDAHFHTLAYVQVEKFLRNDYNLPKDQLPIMIASGPTSSGGKMFQVGEDTLRIGEYALFFLNANHLILDANYSEMYDLFDQLINDPTIRFKISAKFDLKDEKLIAKNKLIDLSVVKDDVDTVMKIIQSNKSSGN